MCDKILDNQRLPRITEKLTLNIRISNILTQNSLVLPRKSPKSSVFPEFAISFLRPKEICELRRHRQSLSSGFDPVFIHGKARQCQRPYDSGPFRKMSNAMKRSDQCASILCLLTRPISVQCSQLPTPHLRPGRRPSSKNKKLKSGKAYRVSHRFAKCRTRWRERINLVRNDPDLGGSSGGFPRPVGRPEIRTFTKPYVFPRS